VASLAAAAAAAAAAVGGKGRRRAWFFDKCMHRIDIDKEKVTHETWRRGRGRKKRGGAAVFLKRQSPKRKRLLYTREAKVFTTS
jgi:hypothetical protein